MREYQLKLGRFMAEDVIKGNGAVLKTLNRYGYCWNSPLILVDSSGREPEDFIPITCLPMIPLPIGVFGIAGEIDVDGIIDWYADDEKGKELVERYVYGDGSDYIIDNSNESWRNYMVSNETLALQTGYYLNPIGENLQRGESKEINIEIPIILQDKVNQHSGYMLLYGSNADVGGYQISGIVSKDMNGTVTYDMAYTFNDIMDPNFNYLGDKVAYAGMKFLQMCGQDITLNEYNIQISWSDVTIIDGYGNGNEGWLKDMQSINPDNELNKLEHELLISPAYLRGKKEILKSTMEFYQRLRDYISEHPEYYECSTM